MSFLAEQTLHCKAQQGRVCISIYYYFSYRHRQDAPLAFVNWVVSQLCRRLLYLPTEISDLFRQGHLLSLTQLKGVLVTFLKKLDMLYVTLDTIDEVDTREDLLSLPVEICTRPEFEKIHIVISSRNYVDIADTLEPYSSPIDMSDPRVDADIRQYAESKVTGKRRFSRWPTGLKTEAIDALAKGVKGI
ncbi:hypothetical protein P154DRAFT_570352 [Amniculicola lignicola CBS 123094]|uniref:Nephrocystin 3-like N-terminal domain-containing protein n=1 Tax=Amniculicola lignicola CBS 123094 TaxID=1392246 RepID=A0A6A5WZQ7_9PLEO|nr:hypothetical protein P154DRAFT_570352 [Amniculicola lignicola CBS 123094]